MDRARPLARDVNTRARRALIVTPRRCSTSGASRWVCLGAANAHCTARPLLLRCLFDNHCIRQDDPPTGVCQ